MSSYIDPATIRPEHLTSARLFADRYQMVSELAPASSSDIAEIGVALGDFSEHLIKTCRPSDFHAFDTFDMHLWPEHWGRPSSELFGESTHLETYVNRLDKMFCRLHTYVGMSAATLPRCSKKFDFIYVDGAHDYANVVADARQIVSNLATGGIAIFNDYTHWDHFMGVPYGVIQAVNEVVSEGLFSIVGFALEKNGFHDIALKKI